MKTGIGRVLKITGIAMLVIITALAYMVFLTGPELPENTNAILNSVVNTEVPEFVTGQTGYVVSDGYRIWYESITPDDSIKGTVLLFMGISNDALGWPQKFIDNIILCGYRVIRFDYRGTGLSDWSNGNNDSILFP